MYRALARSGGVGVYRAGDWPRCFPSRKTEEQMSIHRIAKNHYQIVLYVRGNRRDRIFRGPRREAEAYAAKERLKMEAEDPNLDLRVVPTFSSFCVTHYSPHAEVHLKSNTWKKRRYQVATLIEFFGGEKMSELHPSRMTAFKKKRRRDGLQAVSINNELRILRRILNFAQSRNIPVATTTVEFLPEPKRGRVKLWTEEQVAQLFEACIEHSPNMLGIVVFLANTGCRRGEALALTWENVNMEGGLIEITPSEEWQPKDGEPREIPIGDALMPWLAGERASSKWVFPCPKTGNRYAYWPEKKFQRAQKAAGLSGGAHTLRHTYASHFLQRQPDLFLLARVLGHSDVAVTKLYSHLLPDHLARARNAVIFEAPIGPATLAAQKRWGVAKSAGRQAT